MLLTWSRNQSQLDQCILLWMIVTQSMVASTAFLLVPPFLSSASSTRLPVVRQSQQPHHQSHQQEDSSSPEEDAAAASASIQWELFRKHQAKGSWKGIWTTYDYMGDVQDETVGAVDLNLLVEKKNDNDDAIVVQHSHQIVMGAKRSDCATCFDSMDVKTLPIATYSPENLLQKSIRCASCAMVVGPRVLKSGAMATELVLSHGDARVRVVLQHAPVWERGVTPGSCPPQGLKLFRVVVSREALRPTPPTVETERERIQAFLLDETTTTTTTTDSDTNPLFYRPVKPFDWHKKWGGTSWTWGPQSGDRGWSLLEMEDADAWHGSAPVDRWNLRLPDGIFVQAPRIVSSSETGIYRLAWLPSNEMLLRVEAGVQALQPMVLDDKDDLVGFQPPSLVSLRCDVLQNNGDLEGEPLFVKESESSQSFESKSATGPSRTQAEAVVAAAAETESSTPKVTASDPLSQSSSDGSTQEPKETASSRVPQSPNNFDEAGADLKAIRDALKL